MTTIFTFDLDGTITKQELLPLIASALGLQREMNVLTKLTLDGTIDFEDSFRLRCAILQSIPISDVQSIVQDVPLDKDIVKFIQANVDSCYVVTGNLDLWIKPLIDQLGCRFYSSTARHDGDRLLGLRQIMHKSRPINELRASAARIVAIGDSVNDVPMFEAADTGIAYGGVHDPAANLVEIADYITYTGNALCRLLNTL
ncbi:HAD family phosphatase [Bordetella sp. N]|uniref:HAD family hydrolase n=1 Tax=Bordetella sp. N TaxID=1746199 RepID=UPI00070EFEED|nr:HAD family phosphatase [Bordetella sp. N]ALM85277.1 hypothetical protein ASB57_21945 [Bordetella sp. N]